MSHRFFTWTLFLLASSPALAHARAEIIDLPHCGGEAVIYRNERQIVIKLDEVDDCSNITVDGQRLRMQLQPNDRYAFVYTWQPTLYRDQLILRVHSNSSRTEDEVRVEANAEGWNRRPGWERPVSWHQPPPVVTTVRDDDLIYLDESRNTALLPDCGGRVRVDLEHHRLVVRVEGPNTCDRVRLTVFNQQPLLLESVRRVDRECGVWTFAVPERAVRPGRNSLTLSVHSSRHDRSDLVRYYFSDRRWFFASGGR